MVNIINVFDSSASGFFINLIAAIVILLIGVILARIASNFIKKLLKELELERILSEQSGIKVPISDFSSSIIKYIIYFIAIIMALNQIGLTTTVLQILLGVILVVIVILGILAFKDLIPNVVAGALIYQKKLIEKGERIKIKDFEGRVLEVSLVETKIKTKKGEIIFIPNSVITKNEIIKLKK